MTEVNRAAEFAARTAYGRLLAMLASRSYDISLAEDALSDAFSKALSTWPLNGIPTNPEGWLFSVARNRLTDIQRHHSRFPTDNEIPDLPDDRNPPNDFPDKRLALMMVCTHPAIAENLHTALMLQTVLGIDVKTISRLFMMSPTALSKQLVRAKQKIKVARIPFQVPEIQYLPERVAALLEAIYALHSHDWLEPKNGFGDEALYLVSLLIDLIPHNPEVLGLSALIAFGHARRNSRISEGMLVPIEEQDASKWDELLINYGFRQLARAQDIGQHGRFQIEAAIQSFHILSRHSPDIDWVALSKLYFALIQLSPTVGALVAYAVVKSRLHGPDLGLQELDQIESQLDIAFQPLWAARADLLKKKGSLDLAAIAYKKAISLTTETPEKLFLEKRLNQLYLD